MSMPMGASSSSVGFLLNQLTEVMRLFHVAGDHPAEAVESMFLDGHPHFQRAELT